MKTFYFEDTPGQTIYAFPEAQSLASWASLRVACTEAASPNTGRYSVSLDETLDWVLFAGASQPATFDDNIGNVPAETTQATDLTPVLDAISALSQVAVVVSGPSAPANELAIQAGSDFSSQVSITIPASWSKVIFTAKASLADPDSASIVQVVKTSTSQATDGALYVAGASAGSLKNSCSLTVDATGDTVTIFLGAAATTLMNAGQNAEYRSFKWHIQVIVADGTVPSYMTNANGKITRLASRTIT